MSCSSVLERHLCSRHVYASIACHPAYHESNSVSHFFGQVCLKLHNMFFFYSRISVGLSVRSSPQSLSLPWWPSILWQFQGSCHFLVRTLTARGRGLQFGTPFLKVYLQEMIKGDELYLSNTSRGERGLHKLEECSLRNYLCHFLQ